MTRGSRLVYVLNEPLHRIGVYTVHSDGSLVRLPAGAIESLPAGANGLIARRTGVGDPVPTASRKGSPMSGRGMCHPQFMGS